MMKTYEKMKAIYMATTNVRLVYSKLINRLFLLEQLMDFCKNNHRLIIQPTFKWKHQKKVLLMQTSGEQFSMSPKLIHSIFPF